MPTDNERLAVVEEKTDSQGEILKRVDETLTQLRIYTESSQRLMESHDRGIQDLNKRELNRERDHDAKFDTIMNKFHQSELDHATQAIQDRVMFEQLIKDYAESNKSIIKNIVDNDEKREIRIRNLENLKWRFAGVMLCISTAVGFVAPTLIRQLLS